MQDNTERSVSLEGQLESISQKGIKLEKNSLKDEEYRQLVGLIYQNVDLFATGMKDLVGTDIVKHDIDTGDARPIRKRTSTDDEGNGKTSRRNVGGGNP